MSKFKISCRLLFAIGLLVSLSAFSPHLHAQHGWTVNPADFSNSGQVTAVVIFDGVQVTSGTLGAFVDDTCRGFIDAMYFPPSDWYTFELLAYSNQSSGETLTFRYYNPDDSLIYDVNETIELVADMREGNSAEPLVYSVTTNGAPVVDTPIDDLSLNEYFGSTTIDLSTVFSDPDGDPLIFSGGSSNTDVVTVSFSDNILTITEEGLGSSTVTVTADDGTETTDEVFAVTVNDINGAPVVDNTLPDVDLNEYFVEETVDLSGVFSDPDPGDVLTLSVTSSDPTVVTASIDGSTLTITEVGLGSSTITVTATDDGSPVLSVSEAFTVTVNNVNDAPEVVQSLDDIETDEHFGSTTVDLTGVFTDKDEDALTITASSSDAGVVVVSVEGDLLTITEVGPGVAVITVTASDGSLSVQEQFIITVIDINDAPELAVPLPDQNIVENIGSAEIDLDTYFTDRDGDVLDYSVELRDTGIVSYLLEDLELVLNPLDTGSTMVTVIASDPEGLMVADSFMVSVVKEFMFIVSYESSRIQNQDTIILCNDAGQITVKISTEVTWSYTNNYSWLALEVREDSTLSLAFSANLTGADRVGDITLFDTQGHAVKIILKQTEDCLSSVYSSDLWVDLQMVPNPVSEKLFIHTGERLPGDLRLEVYDFRGTLLYLEEVAGGVVAGSVYEVDMSGYTEGMYMIRISDERGSFTGKIVKQ